ncbi:MAG TPA: 50S ribosomal protein L5 [Phycisphaerae bacterium]|nr:50S ribosomal protein L5 [Phycisphaerae bacterium]
MPRLLERYRETIVPSLQEKLGRRNVLSLPRLEKIVVSMGLGKSSDEPKRIEAAVKDLATLTGQRPVLTKAKKSVAAFHVRQGVMVGAMVTLRGRQMYEFLDRLINLAIPRVRDFRGLDPASFDGRGNYSLGLSEQLVFPEIRVDDVKYQQGMNITIVVKNSRSDEESRFLLEGFGFPFRHDGG